MQPLVVIVFFLFSLRVTYLIKSIKYTIKDREFVEIDSTLSAFNTKLMALKLKHSDRLYESNLLNNLLTCLCRRRKFAETTGNNSNADDTNDNNNNNTNNPNDEKNIEAQVKIIKFFVLFQFCNKNK